MEHGTRVFCILDFFKRVKFRKQESSRDTKVNNLLETRPLLFIYHHQMKGSDEISRNQRTAFGLFVVLKPSQEWSSLCLLKISFLKKTTKIDPLNFHFNPSTYCTLGLCWVVGFAALVVLSQYKINTKVSSPSSSILSMLLKCHPTWHSANSSSKAWLKASTYIVSCLISLIWS